MNWLMIDIEGFKLTADDRHLLKRAEVAGVILFTRNYESKSQARELIKSIRAVRSEPILIAVDQEGGRVQRFQKGFTRLPYLKQIGDLYDLDPVQGLVIAKTAGFVMARELREVGVDFSFAPVLDLYDRSSRIIGDRAFAADPLVVTTLGQAFIQGVHTAGMIVVAKHFPGHGSVDVDSHISLPIDNRDRETIFNRDLYPFTHLHAQIEAIMTAHVVYKDVSDEPATFSKLWLDTILRQKLHYKGIIFSDDLSMGAVSAAKDALARVRLALDAGCDIVLLCNNRSDVEKVLASSLLIGRSNNIKSLLAQSQKVSDMMDEIPLDSTALSSMVLNLEKDKL